MKSLDEIKNEKSFKLVLIGNTSVGKSSLVNRMTGKNFLSECSTIGAAFNKIRRKYRGNDGEKDEFYNLHIWDTAGQERFRSITNLYYNGANIILLIYDVTALNTLTELIEYWIPTIFQHVNSNRGHGSDEILLYIIGNKSDLTDETSNSSLESRQKGLINDILIKYPQSKHFFVSAKTEEGVGELFQDIYQTLDSKMAEPVANVSVNSDKDTYINIVPLPATSSWQSWKWKCW